MEHVNVEVKISDVTLDTVLRSYEEADVTVGDRVAQIITDRIAANRDYWDGIARRIREIRDEEIRAAVRPLVAEALEQPFRKTTHYGEPTGPEVTLRSLIVETAQDYLTKPAGNSYDRGGQTVVAKLIAEEVDKAFKAEVAAAVKEVRESVAKEFGTNVAEKFAAVAREALRSR